MISSTDNPKVKYISSLKKGKIVKGKNEFIIEGLHLVEEALAAQISGKCIIKYILYSAKLQKNKEGTDVLNKLSGSGIKIEEVSEKILNILTEVETPQGMIGVVEHLTADLSELFDDESPIILILDGIQDPGNLGTIIRSASAFGVSGIIMSGDSVSLYNQKVIRSTVGTIFKIRSIRVDNIKDISHALKRRGIALIATDANAPKTIIETDMVRPVAVFIGSEGKGIKKENMELCDETVSIPIRQDVESLNAAVSASVILYEITRQRKVRHGR